MKLLFFIFFFLLQVSFLIAYSQHQKKDVWIDRFDKADFQALTKSTWYSFSDSSNKGKSTIKMHYVQDAQRESQVLRYAYQLQKGDYQWSPYVALACSLSKEQFPAGVLGIAYEFKGNEHSFIYRTKNIKDYAFYQKVIPVSKEWTTVVIPFSELNQPTWGSYANFNVNDVNSLSWQVVGKSNDSGSVFIDNVRLLYKLKVIKTPPVKKVKAPSSYLSNAMTQSIDSLFLRWNKKGSPGGVIGIVRNDSILYAKGYGLANVEYDSPNTPETVFHIASVSKQFTTYAIILLAREGKLKQDDDIRRHLPWFPDLGHKITIQHLMNHTSGIRDQWELLSIAGTQLEDVITQEEVVKVLSRQTALNFIPGEEYMYCNSGFTLLAEIVKSVSGKTLRAYTDSAIFVPLSMKRTFFMDDYAEVIKDRAYSYNLKSNNQFSNAKLNYGNVGPTNLMTTVNDLSKWVMNFYAPKAGDEKDIALLTQKAKLNDGRELPYANGLVVETSNGIRKFSHGGFDAGYRTNLVIYPDYKMGFIALGNASPFDPYSTCEAMRNVFIKSPTAAKEPKDSSKTILKDSLSMQKFMGLYLSEDGLESKVYSKNNRLYYLYKSYSYLLAQETADTFYNFNYPDVKFIFKIENKDTTVSILNSNQLYRYVKYVKSAALTEDQLRDYTGVYDCPELKCRYEIIVKNKELFLTSNKYPDDKLTLINDDHLKTNLWFMGHLKVLRNDQSKIKGFEVNSSRIRHLKFDKIE